MADDLDLRIGARIRAARERLGESLRAFATRCGVSASMLSDVERGEKSPTITILSAISEGLGIPLSRLVADERDLDLGPSVVRAADTTTVVDPESGVRRSNLGPVTSESKVEFVRFAIPAGKSTGGFAAHGRGTVERVYVVAGEIELRIGERSVVLARGDAALYRAVEPHSFHARGERAAEILLLIERP